MSSRASFTAAFVLVAPVVLGTFGSQATAHAMQEVESQEPSTDDAWEELSAKYEAELADWNARVRASKGVRERAAARREDPTPLHAPAFERLADAGEIRALFWLLEHLSDLGGRSAERKQRRLALYERMIREHGGSELLIEGMALLHADSRFAREHGIETIERLTDEALQTLASEVGRDTLRLGLAGRFSKSQDAQSVARAVALLEGVLAAQRLPSSELEQAEDLRFELLHLRLGCEAPDFEGLTVDGEPVRLADTRGKVVVLDFFGFW